MQFMCKRREKKQCQKRHSNGVEPGFFFSPLLTNLNFKIERARKLDVTNTTGSLQKFHDMFILLYAQIFMRLTHLHIQ